MALRNYRRILASRQLRQALVLGFLVRMPVFTGIIVLTLHVVSTLGHTYAAAGFVTAAATACIAVSGPWRGRLLDTRGLRKVVLPSVLVNAVCWSVAPFVGYWALLLLAALAGLFVVPVFAIVRQAVIAAVPASDRRTGIALDGVFIELSFMMGPALGIWAATVWPTSWVLFTIQMTGVAAGVLIWIVNPALRGSGLAPAEAHTEQVISRRTWLRPHFIALCLAAAASTIVLSGTDITVVAALRDFDRTSQIGLVLAVWGFGSLLGGLIYGGMRRGIPSAWLLLGLSIVTIPMAFAAGVPSLSILAFVAGLFCAPVVTATVDEVSRAVPELAHGEALGWHASAMTGGSALGAPFAGIAIDRFGWGGGFVAVGLVGLVVVAVVAAAPKVRAQARAHARVRAAARV